MAIDDYQATKHVLLSLISYDFCLLKRNSFCHKLIVNIS